MVIIVNKKICVLVIVFLFLIIGIFYINKKNLFNQDIINDKLNVYFYNMKASVINGGVFVPEEPIIEKTSIKAYDVLISNPGDYATWTFDVVNNGNVDAKISNYIKINPKCVSLMLPANYDDENLVCNNLEYKILYSKNNQEVKKFDILKAGSSENLTIKVGYNNNQMLTGDVQVIMYDIKFSFNNSK